MHLLVYELYIKRAVCLKSVCPFISYPCLESGAHPGLELFLLTDIKYRANYRIKRFVMLALRLFEEKVPHYEKYIFLSIYRNPDVQDPAFNNFYSGSHFSNSHACLVLSMVGLRRVKGSCVLKWLAIMPNIKNYRKLKSFRNPSIPI